MRRSCPGSVLFDAKTGERDNSMIITCASYYATGSSAVTDLFSEFANCSSVGNREFRFIHDPDGLRDLEYNLIENNNRHNTSAAIKRFLKYTKYIGGNPVRKGYSRFMGQGRFFRLSRDFVDQITELRTHGWWHYDQIQKGPAVVYMDNALSKLLTWIQGKHARYSKRYSVLDITNEQAYYSAIDRDTFYRLARDYVAKVVDALNRSRAEYVMVDQLLPPSNVDQYLNYFDDDIRVVVVERDPRDLYVNTKVNIREKVIPIDDVKEFCQWYKITRRHRRTEVYDPKRVCFLRFEDLIYRYEETRDRLVAFVGMDLKDHIHPLTAFDPAVSIHSTNMKARFPQYRDDVEYIEKTLPEYLYEFPEEN